MPGRIIFGWALALLAAAVVAAAYGLGLAAVGLFLAGAAAMACGLEVACGAAWQAGRRELDRQYRESLVDELAVAIGQVDAELVVRRLAVNRRAAQGPDWNRRTEITIATRN